jgi:hypothetical protein
MGYPEKAVDVYTQVRERISDPSRTAFFQGNEDLGYLAEAAETVAKFVLDRPAMAVADAIDPQLMLKLLWLERYEAREVECVCQDEKQSLEAELGDTMHFAILTGMLHWEDLDSHEREFVLESVKYVEKIARDKDIDVAKQVVGVAGEKDVVNYPEVFYQVGEGDKAKNMSNRVGELARLGKKLRPQLNNEWVGMGDRLIDVMVGFSGNGAKEEEKSVICRMLHVADLVEYEMV